MKAGDSIAFNKPWLGMFDKGDVVPIVEMNGTSAVIESKNGSARYNVGPENFDSTCTLIPAGAGVRAQLNQLWRIHKDHPWKQKMFKGDLCIAISVDLDGCAFKAWRLSDLTGQPMGSETEEGPKAYTLYADCPDICSPVKEDDPGWTPWLAELARNPHGRILGAMPYVVQRAIHLQANAVPETVEVADIEDSNTGALQWSKTTGRCRNLGGRRHRYAYRLVSGFDPLAPKRIQLEPYMEPNSGQIMLHHPRLGRGVLRRHSDNKMDFILPNGVPVGTHLTVRVLETLKRKDGGSIPLCVETDE